MFFTHMFYMMQISCFRHYCVQLLYCKRQITRIILRPVLSSSSGCCKKYFSDITSRGTYNTLPSLTFNLTANHNNCTGNSRMAVSATPKCLTNSDITEKRFPAEWEPHARTFMVWPASKDIWGDLLNGVRKDISSIAKAIAKYEEVVVLVEPSQEKEASKALGSEIRLIPMAVNDLWARDTLPAFLENSEHGIFGVDLHFNGWGSKQVYAKDRKIAEQLLAKFNLSCVSSPLIAEGGGLETDGQGTLLATESSLVNENRNPGKSRDKIEQELKETLGVSKVIWVKGVKGGDITDAHIDAIARFASPNVVVLGRPSKAYENSDDEDNEDVWAQSSDQAKEVLQNATDSTGKAIKMVEIYEPDPDKITGKGKEFLSSYINYYVANGAVIVPAFGDKDADKAAQATLKELYPGREIVPVNIDNLASGGGGIHCATHDMPAGSHDND